MEGQIQFTSKDPFEESISPLWEMAAYECLWDGKHPSFKSIAEIFARYPGVRPSDLVPKEQIHLYKTRILGLIDNAKTSIGKPSIIINNTVNYPDKLRDAKEPVEILYYSGNLNLIYTKSIAIVGSRKPSEDGLRRTRKLVELLVKDKVTIVSGLAEGIDREAHATALRNGGSTIAVIGTPLNRFYPLKNRSLQETIAKDHLLISQVPYWIYSQQNYLRNRLFFPERNKTMSALTEATVIVEASETSGTLIQARAALQQKRKLFILESCFQNEKISWPKRFEEKGAIRVREYSDIRKVIFQDEKSLNGKTTSN